MKFIRTAFFTLFAIVALTVAAHADETFVVNMDGAQAGSGSTGTGFGAAVLHENGFSVTFMAKWDGLSGTPNLHYGVALYDETGTNLGYFQRSGTIRSLPAEFSASGAVVAKLRQGKISVVVSTPNFPNGEIRGKLVPYSGFSGRIGGANSSNSAPNVKGFVTLVLNREETDGIAYYRYTGFPQNGVNGLMFGSGVLTNGSANAAAMFDLGSYMTVDANLISRIKQGREILLLSQNGALAKGFVKPINKDVDFNGDSRADYAVYRPEDGTFYWLNKVTGQANGLQWGSSQAIPVPSDFDGDGLTDYSVWLPSNGYFYIRNAYDLSIKTAQWGKTGDVPLPADYDGDGKSDFAVYRPGANNTQSVFWILRSTGDYYAVSFGLGNDVPLIADFDGDRINDVTVFRPSNGTFYSLLSSSGALKATPWGVATDKPAIADFDGDGKSDYLVYRPDTRFWYVLTSGSNYSSYIAKKFGLANPTLQPSDFDGDGKADFAYFKNGIWAYLSSIGGNEVSDVYGLFGDIPLHGK